MLVVDDLPTAILRFADGRRVPGYRLLADDGDEMALCRMAQRIGVRRWRVSVSHAGVRYLVITAGQRIGAIAHGAQVRDEDGMRRACEAQLDTVTPCAG